VGQRWNPIHIFATEREMRTLNWVQASLCIVASKRVEFVSDRMPYIILRGRWCHIIVLNVQASTWDKTHYMKDSSYEELEQVLNKFPKYNKRILLEVFNIEGESIKIPHIKEECSHIVTFIKLLVRLQMGKPTIRLTIF
jgi:hypothetical protein